MGKPRATVSAAVLLLLLVVPAACSKPAPPDEATLREGDRRTLEHLVALDVRASRALRDADEAAHAGDGGAATFAITGRAVPAVDEGLRAADEAAPTMKSEWGRQRRDELAAILRDRKAEMPKYEEAVTSNDPDKMLAAIQAQAAIERRALATVAAVQENR